MPEFLFILNFAAPFKETNKCMKTNERVLEEVLTIRARLRSRIINDLIEKNEEVSEHDIGLVKQMTTDLAVVFVTVLAHVSRGWNARDWNDFWQRMSRRIFRP